MHKPEKQPEPASETKPPKFLPQQRLDITEGKRIAIITDMKIFYWIFGAFLVLISVFCLQNLDGRYVRLPTFTSAMEALDKSTSEKIDRVKSDQQQSTAQLKEKIDEVKGQQNTMQNDIKQILFNVKKQ